MREGYKCRLFHKTISVLFRDLWVLSVTALKHASPVTVGLCLATCTRQLSLGLATWTFAAADRKESTRLLRKGGGHVFMRRAALGFGAWEREFSRKKVTIQGSELSRAIKHWINRRMSRGWNGWVVAVMRREAEASAILRGLVWGRAGQVGVWATQAMAAAGCARQCCAYGDRLADDMHAGSDSRARGQQLRRNDLLRAQSPGLAQQCLLL